MNNYLIFLGFHFLTFFISAQTENKDVTITATGSGSSQEFAKQTALRNAIEQAFGTFISSKTEIFNDEIVADQMSSVSSGNVKSYEVLNESLLPNGTWASTLRVIVSVDKLTSFVEAKGITVEMKGGLFAMNIKQQLLNEESERNIISNLTGTIHNLLQQSFDYSLDVKDPQSVDGSSENWEVPMTIYVKPNRNMDFCKNYFLSTLNSIGLSNSELENYNRLKKPIFEIDFKFGDSLKKFFLRNQSSIIEFRRFENLSFYTHSFYIDNGLKSIREIGNSKMQVKENYYNRAEETMIPIITFPFNNDMIKFPKMEINFISSRENKNQVVYSYNDVLRLDDISKISKYEIKQDSIRNEFINGGYRIKKNKTDIILAPEALRFQCQKTTYNQFVDPNTKNYLKNVMDSILLSINTKNFLGYNNWRIISKDELEALLTNFSSNSFDNNLLNNIKPNYQKYHEIISSTEEIVEQYPNDFWTFLLETSLYKRDYYRLNYPNFKLAENRLEKTIILVRDYPIK
jgi:hypothetical protein